MFTNMDFLLLLLLMLMGEIFAFFLQDQLSLRTVSIILILLCSKDTPAEHEIIKKSAIANGAFDAIVSTHWNYGGTGASALADAVIKACDSKSDFKFLYDLNLTIEEKLIKIAKEMYGAGSVETSQKVKETIKLYTDKVSTRE